MALKHSVYDTDAHFKIDPITHMIKNESSNKNVLIQHDHNSERFTFEIPRMVDGHDMSKCDVVQIHYINIDSQDKNNTSKDVHDVDDLQISPDGDDVVICSWLIDGNATKYAGSLNFLVKFKCIGDDGSACYVWNTAIFTGIFVSPGIENGEAIVEDYSDVLEQWRKELYEAAEKTHYTERVQVLAQTNLEYDEDMNAFTYPEHLHLIAGQEYTVRWNGVEYVCTAYEISEWSAMGLGDFASAGVPSVAPSNEPFAIGETKDDPPVVFVPLDESTKVTVSIHRDVVHKLDNKYLDLDWIPKKTGTVILPAQIARLNNGVVSVEAIDAAYRVNGTKINVLIDGIHHDTEIHVDGNDIYANIEFGYDNRVMILFSTTRTFMVGKNLDGRTVEIWLDDAVCSKIPVEYLPDGYGSGGNAVIASGSGAMVKLELKEGHTIEVSGETTEAVNLYHTGKNLAPAYTGADISKNGTTVTKEANGKITVSGTPTASTYVDVYKKTDPYYLPAGTYTMIPYGFPEAIPGGSTGLSYMFQSVDQSIAKVVSTSTGVSRFTLETGTFFAVTVTVQKGYDGEKRTIGVMLIDKDVTEEEAKNYKYEPYVGARISTALPASVKAYNGTNIVYADGADTLNVTVKETIMGVIDERVKKVTAFDYTAYNLPILYLNGDTSAMTKDVSVDLSYIYGERSGTASVKWQGSSSLKYPKKNYTVKFDNAFEAVEGWGAQKKYCMKANFIDFSHARNLCCAKLWGQIVASRNPANEAIAACPNYGAVDGFPICIVINGEYHGVYTFNIPKDGWMLNMGSGTQEAILCADLNSPANNFKAEAVVGGDKTDFELEYTTDEDNADWVQTSLNNLIRACINSDGSDLDTTIAAMLDWDSVIDYYIFSALIDHRDGIGKNYLLHTYDGTKWAYDAYDMDSVFGLHWDGDLDAARFLTSQAGMSFGYLRNAHRLVELIVAHKKDKLKSRYSAIRAGAMSEDNVQMVLRNFAGSIPRQLLEEDNRKWTTIPNTNANTVQQAIDWYRLRVAKIDKEVDAL